MNGVYFIDKSGILAEIIPLIRTSQKYICITRPRRFGKTTIANMIGTFFQNHVIRQIYSTILLFHMIWVMGYIWINIMSYTWISATWMMPAQITVHLSAGSNGVSRKTLSLHIPGFRLMKIRPFQKIWYLFLLFLKVLLRDRSYVDFAYMTGILPIAKYRSSICQIFFPWKGAMCHKRGDTRLVQWIPYKIRKTGI